jgi:twitching motility protein PilT
MTDDGSEPSTLLDLLRFAVSARARDLLLAAGAPPMMRPIGGDELHPLALPPLTAEDARRYTYAVLTDGDKEHFEQHGSISVSFGIRDLGRFRLRMHHQRAAIAACYRLLPAAPPTDVAPLDIAANRGSLVVIAGPSGSGKSYVAATIVEAANRDRAWRIVTVENPIEIVHPHKRSIVEQIDVPADSTLSLALGAARGADLVFLQSLGAETLPTALALADGGAAVIGTLDASSPEGASRMLASICPLRGLVKTIVFVPGVGVAPRIAST